MPRGKTPLITIEVPEIGTGDEYERGREIVIEHYGIGGEQLEFDIIYTPVEITARDPITGEVVLKERYIPPEWDSLNEFLERIRLRLTDPLDAELVDVLKDEVEALSIEIRSTRDKYTSCQRNLKRVIRQRDEQLAPEGLLSVVDLERRARALRDLATVASLPLSRWSHPTIASLVKSAREIFK